MKIPLIFGLAGILCGAAGAQTFDGDIPATLQPAAKRTFQIPLRNVKPSVMAYWLDPFSPVNSQRAASPSFAMPPFPAEAKGTSQVLPSGVDRIVAVDPQNALLVFGTSEGAGQLEKTIRVLDRPLRQLEIEARFFRIAADEVEKLGMDFRTTAMGSRISLVQGNIDEALGALQEQKKALLLTAPRVTTFNGSFAELKYADSTPATWDVKATRSKGDSRLFSQGNLQKLPAGTALKVVTSQSLQVMPTINADGTVTLQADSEQKSELQGTQTTDGAIVLERHTSPRVLANMRDGDTIAIEEPSEGRDTATKTIVLLTPRIIRRVGDEDQTAP